MAHVWLAELDEQSHDQNQPTDVFSFVWDVTLSVLALGRAHERMKWEGNFQVLCE